MTRSEIAEFVQIEGGKQHEERETANSERGPWIIERSGNPSESSAALLLICTPRPANRGG